MRLASKIIATRSAGVFRRRTATIAGSRISTHGGLFSEDGLAADIELAKVGRDFFGTKESLLYQNRRIAGKRRRRFAAQASSIWNWRSKRCSSTPRGLLKKLARKLSRPVCPGAGPTRSSESGRSPGRRQHRIAALPDELQRHRRAQEAGEVDVVPGGLPIAQAFDELDRDVASAGL